jgi:hypothetical protein
MPRARKERCQLAARVREPRERTGRTRARKYSYWRAPLRMCRAIAVAKVLFVGQPGELHVCRRCFNREAIERPGDWLEFEMLEGHDRGRAKRARAERSSVDREERRPLSMERWKQLEVAGLDPTAPREIGELLRQECRELGIPGALAPGADSGLSHVGPDHAAAAVAAAHRT